MDRRSRSPQKRGEVRRPISISRRRRLSVDEGRQVTHAFKEFAAHSANVNCLALGHKSGRVLVTGGDDKKVNLWAVGKPNCILSLSGHTTAVECVRFGSNESLVCAGSLSGALKIWDLEATKILRTLTGHKANIRSIDFHPYGDFICTGSLDTNIKLWDIRRKGCIFTYKGHNLTVNSLKFSPDGQWIASAGEDSVVKLWDLRAGKMMTEFNSHSGPVSDVEFHPHEFLLASSSHDRTVNFWDLEKFQLVSTTDADTGPIRTIAFHPTGECIYAGATDVLKVYGWEPSRTFDTVAMGWGKIQDVAIAQNQLIGAAFHGVYVSLYVIDLKRVQPLGEPENDIPTMFKHGAAIRKSFIKDKSSGKASCDSIKTEEASDTGGEEPQEEDPPPVISNVTDYETIFRTHRELQRTPPPPNSSGNENDSVVVPQIPRLDTAHLESQRLPPHPVVLPRAPTPELGRKQTASILPRTHGQRSDHNSNVSSPTTNFSPTTLPNLLVDRRGSTNDLSAQYTTHQREVTVPSPTSSLQSHRMRASSESRREFREGIYGSHPGLDQEQRYNIRHSPSEPYIAQSPQQGPPMSSSPPVQHVSTTLPNLARHDVPPYRNSPSAPKSDMTSHVKPIDRPMIARPPFSRGSGTSGSSCSETMSSPYSRIMSSEPEISYMGSPKEVPDYNRYDLDKLSNRDYIYPYPNSRSKDGLNIEDFLPKQFSSGMSLSGFGGFNGITGIAGNEFSEQEVMSSVVSGHTSMMSVINARARALQITRKLWQTKDLKSAVEHVLNTSDQAILVDFLAILNLRSSIWNLDILSLLLPPVSLLLQNKHESSVNCGCDTLKLMVKHFAPIIKSNMQGPIHSVGIDISREERYNKCIECYNHMMSIRACLLKRQTVPGKLGHTYRELVILMQALD